MPIEKGFIFDLRIICNFLDLFSTPIDLKLVDRAKYAMAEVNSKTENTQQQSSRFRLYKTRRSWAFYVAVLYIEGGKEIYKIEAAWLGSLGP